MTTVHTYDFREIPYFSIDIDADVTGLCIAEIIGDEYAKLAKEKLNDGDYDDAIKFCRVARDFEDAIQTAKEMIAKKQEEVVEDADIA